MDGLAIDAGRIVVELVAVAEIAPHADSVSSRNPPWNSYELTTTASASRAARSPSGSACASAAGSRRDRACSGTLRGAAHRLDAARRRADRSTGPRQIADSAARPAALDAALEMREVARRATAA